MRRTHAVRLRALTSKHRRLNSALRKFFPIYSPGITDAVEASIIAAIEAAMAVPPSPVSGVEVQGVDLGVNPPQLSMIKSFNLPGNEWQMDANFQYQSDIRIVVAVAIGAKGFSLKIPIAVKDLMIDGRVRITLSMASEPPLYKTLTVSFKSPPEISVSLQPLKAFDLDKIPMLGRFLRDTIVSAVTATMVYPQRLTIELGDAKPAVVESDAAEKLDADGRAAREVDPEAGTPMHPVRQAMLAAQRKPEYIGRLRVIVKSAAGLRAADKSLLGATSDPYCKVFCGAELKATPVIKKTLTPEWNTTLDFLVERAKKYQELEVQVFDEDKLSKDAPLGYATIDFRDLVGDTDSEQVTITARLVGKGSLDGSTITLSMAYIVE
jgi:Ca2+-dependent lipid-binding protein